LLLVLVEQKEQALAVLLDMVAFLQVVEVLVVEPTRPLYQQLVAQVAVAKQVQFLLTEH
jgi:hypothetical protein